MDEGSVIWQWHRGLLRRAAFSLMLYVVIGSLAALIAWQPIQHQNEEETLRALADLHRIQLDDFRAVAKTQRELHSNGLEAPVLDILEPLRVHLRRVPPKAAQCAARWDTALGYLQAPIIAPPDASQAPSTGVDERLLLESLVNFREGLTAAQAMLQFALANCADTSAKPELAPFCSYFATIREKQFAKYQQIAANYTPTRLQHARGPFARLRIGVADDPCLSAPNSLRRYERVAQLADGAALVRTVADFAALGERISNKRAILAQQAGGVVAGVPGGLLTMALSPRTSYLTLVFLACLSLIYGHYSLRRLSDLLKRIPLDASNADYRLWPQFAPVFMPPIATVRFDTPAGRGLISRATHALFKVMDYLPLLTFVGQVVSLIVLAWWSWVAAATFMTPPVIALTFVLLVLQAIVLVDYLRERAVIARWIEDSNRPAPTGAATPDIKGQGDRK